MSDGWVHGRNKTKHEKKCEAKHENKDEAKNQRTHPIWVSSIVHMPLLHSLVLKEKLNQVTRTTTKYASVNTIKIRYG
jgi:hypothetical protein